MKNVLVFNDTETTGLNPDVHGIVELAAIVIVDGVVKEHFHATMRPFPGVEINEEALAISGRTTEEVMSFDDPVAAYEDYTGMLRDYIDPYDKKDKAFFAGYNGYFDLNMLHAHARRANDKYFGSWYWWPAIDVAQEALRKLMAIRHTFKSFNLESVAAHFGITPEQFGGNAHSALVDVKMTKALWDTLMDYEGEQPPIIWR